MPRATRSCCRCSCRSPIGRTSSSVAATGSCSSPSGRTGAPWSCPRACAGARCPEPAWPKGDWKSSSWRLPMTAPSDRADESPPLGASAEAALAALFDAGPEAAEHLLKAAQELLLAAKAVVDAGERAVEAHRSTVGDAEAAAPGESTPPDRGRVRRIDLA